MDAEEDKALLQKTEENTIMDNRLDRRLRLLIIDDGDKASDHEKGYDKIEDHYPYLFKIERVWSWNSRKSAEAGQPLGVQRIMEQAFDLILLDQIFEGHPDMGFDILWQIRNSLGDSPGLSEHQREVAKSNKDVYVIGVSTEWQNYVNTGVAPNAWTPPDKCEHAHAVLANLIGDFIRKRWLERGLDQSKRQEPREYLRQLREMFPGEELQVCCDGETGEPHCWAPPLGAFIRVSGDPLLAQFTRKRPGAVYKIGELDRNFIGASHTTPLHLQPSGEKKGVWGENLASVAKRVPAPGIPSLIDIAKHSVLADTEITCPFDLISTIQSWWVEGAKAFGLSVAIFYNESEPLQPPGMREWLLAPRTEPRRGSDTNEPRELGDIMEWEGRRFVLIGYIRTGEHCVESAAFVPAEEVLL